MRGRDPGGEVSEGYRVILGGGGDKITCNHILLGRQFFYCTISRRESRLS